jgi:hypothetical protein
MSESIQTDMPRDIWPTADTSLQANFWPVDAPSDEPGWVRLFLLVFAVNTVVVMFAWWLVILLN